MPKSVVKTFSFQILTNLLQGRYYCYTLIKNNLHKDILYNYPNHDNKNKDPVFYLNLPEVFKTFMGLKG